MKWNETSESLCPISQTSAVIGDRWTLLILREAFLGAESFDEFQSVLGISPHTLSMRLKRLVAAGILVHPDKRGAPYLLTPAGRALQPLMLLIAQWGNRWRGDAEPQATQKHLACGHHFEPMLICSACEQPIAHDVQTLFTEALTNERKAQTQQSKASRGSHEATP